VGLKGTAVEAFRRGERTWFEGSFSRMRLYLLRLPGGGNLRVTVDGQPLGDQSLAASSPDVLVVEKAFGDAGATHRLQIETVGDGRCRILGLALEGSTGASYSPLGLNGAQASWLLRLPEPILETQLRREAPNLIVLAFGTNEAIGREFDAASYERTLKQLLARIHRCVPLASLLLVAPPDAAFPRGGASALARVSAIQRAQAGAQGAGFVDLRVTMGGSGSIQLWRATGLAQPDLIHFTPPGYTRHGQNILAAMLQGLEGTPRSSGTTADLRSQPPPKVNPIYVFRTRDGRTLITDTPSSVEGLVGQWVGQKPGMKP
jgi:lysophospholipase L1-like esterase